MIKRLNNKWTITARMEKYYCWIHIWAYFTYCLAFNAGFNPFELLISWEGKKRRFIGIQHCPKGVVLGLELRSHKTVRVNKFWLLWLWQERGFIL